MSHATPTVFTLALSAALLCACDKKPSTPPTPKSLTVAVAPQASQDIPAGIVSDPSLPPASQALNEPPAPQAAAAQDTAAAQPTGAVRKEEAAFESLVQKLNNEPQKPGNEPR